MSTKIALVTGGSSGIGEATATRLQSLGFTTYAAARRVERMEHLAKSAIRPLEMDVTDDQSMDSAVEQIVARDGRIDVLVNAAGYGAYGALEDVALSEAKHQFEVNVFGAARLMQLVLPHMRRQHAGTIINITSMGGKIYTPLGAWYHGSKFALEAISDCLRMEVRPFGINVVVIEPGGIPTEWSGISGENLLKASGGGPYGELAKAMNESMNSEGSRRRQSSPTVVADAIAEAVTAERPKTRYVVGYGARPIIFMHELLPDRWFDAFMRRATGVPS